MRKPDRTETQLNQLAALRATADAKSLAPFFAVAHNLVVAKAAKIAAEQQVIGLSPALVNAFDRLMSNPAILDKGCSALTAIVRALYELDYAESDVYLRGIRHVQREASFGRPVDTACEMRGISALGLARTRYDGVLYELARLLADPEWEARRAAARAIACTNDPGAVPLLHYKAIARDESPDVTAECFEGLLLLAPHRFLPFVVERVQSPDDQEAEAALLALGANRSEAATRALIACWPALRASLHPAAVAALASSRRDDAFDFLVSRIAGSTATTAVEIVRALAPYRGNERLRLILHAAVQQRNQAVVDEAFARLINET